MYTEHILQSYVSLSVITSTGIQMQTIMFDVYFIDSLDIYICSITMPNIKAIQQR